MRRFTIGMFVLYGALSGAVSAEAAEIKLLTAGAMRAVIVAMLPDFEAKTGHKVVVVNDTVGALTRRIAGGESFDVAILTPAAVDSQIKDGRMRATSRRDLAKVGMGVAVKEGTPLPDIASVDAFKASLLAAKSVAYIDPKAGGSSGIYFDKLIETLGIADQVRAKAKLKSGGYVAELVVSGDADLAVHQISEIVPVKGARLVGPLPAEIQNVTVYAAGVSTSVRDVGAADALIAFLASPEAKPVLSGKGMDQP